MKRNQYREISFQSHLNNLKGWIYSLIFGSIYCLLIYYTDNDSFILLFFAYFYFIFLIPVVLIHINYYQEDKEKSFVINRNNNSIIVKNRRSEFVVQASDIKKTILTKGLTGHASSPWSNYYYYQIEMKNGKTLYLTSLLIKKDDFNFLIDIERKKAFPFIKNYNIELEKKNSMAKNTENESIRVFYNKYSKYSNEKLNEIVTNKIDFQKNAIIAAEKLLQERTKNSL